MPVHSFLQLTWSRRFWTANTADPSFVSGLLSVAGSGPASYLLGMQNKGTLHPPTLLPVLFKIEHSKNMHCVLVNSALHSNTVLCFFAL